MGGRGEIRVPSPRGTALFRYTRGCFRVGPIGLEDPVGAGLHPEWVDLLATLLPLGRALLKILDSPDGTPRREEFKSEPKL